MKIIDIIRSKEYTVSFEVFPPKTTDTMEKVIESAEKIASLEPDFMSVTYGAGGGTSRYTVDVSTDLQNKFGLPVLSHLTCVSSSRTFVENTLDQYKENGIENIMALRGDIPENGPIETDFKHAYELIELIREKSSDICIGGACYPEGHPESFDLKEDIKHVKEKADTGCDFLTTQLFFDNSKMFEYIESLRSAGVEVPVIAGIMPITRKKQLERSVALSSTSVPSKLYDLVEKYGNDPDEMTIAGIDYAVEQILELMDKGIRNIHLYSMNRDHVSKLIYNTIKKEIS